jgi:hypothetical protein
MFEASKENQDYFNNQLKGLKTKSYEISVFVDGEPVLVNHVADAINDEYEIFEMFEGEVEKIVLDEEYIELKLKVNRWDSNYSVFNEVIFAEWNEDEQKLYVVGNHNVDGCDAIGIHILTFER